MLKIKSVRTLDKRKPFMHGFESHMHGHGYSSKDDNNIIEECTILMFHNVFNMSVFDLSYAYTCDTFFVILSYLFISLHHTQVYWIDQLGRSYTVKLYLKL